MESNSFLEKKFKLSERGTNVKTELMAGLTTFMTMSYILIVNPDILSQTGMDKGALFTTTILASIIANLIMALYANLPFALAPGMGLNAFFTFTVCMQMGETWQFALTAVFLEGIIFILLSMFKIREEIFNAIPMSLKNAVSVGIGLFIAFIGFTGANIITPGDGVILSLGNLLTPNALVLFVGLFLMAFLSAKNVKGALLYGIVGSTILALILGVTKLPQSSQAIFSLPPSIKPIAFQLEFGEIFTFKMFSVMFTFLFVDLFDTVGTLTGVATKADLLDENGELPDVGKALMADAVGTTFGALLGTSTVTTFVESASGVADGGRTGFTTLSTAGCFFISLFFFPLFSIVPTEATSAALIIVGLFMMSPIKNIDFDDFTEAVPAFLAITMMPFAYSIAEGIAFGMMSYVLLKFTTGKRKDISVLMYVLAIIFLLRILAPLFS
ncbi:NCS2 family permease [Anaerosphaera multitolerans]|uniref:NCS2 family permease n=1 Tax=Anaerosphaera multitolerans TaxID=2487351 RepID=A0A437S6K3_9FIRM|nr:NCS2 family permease [Anaerosphaera multitolerans]RVU54621.1 NCS2 family permease [Anaerosphaera multitolerans]